MFCSDRPIFCWSDDVPSPLWRVALVLDVSSKRGQDVIDSILAERDKELTLTKEDKYELDDQLLNVIAKSLSYDSEDRFQSADEFIKAIDGEVKIERQSTKRKILSQQQSDNTPASYAIKRKVKALQQLPEWKS